MRTLLVIENYADFATASLKAKELAINFKEITGVERSAGGWAVLASAKVSSALAKNAHPRLVETKPVPPQKPNTNFEQRYRPGEHPPDNFSQIVTKNAYGYQTDCDYEEFSDAYGTRAFDPSVDDSD